MSEAKPRRVGSSSAFRPKRRICLKILRWDCRAQAMLVRLSLEAGCSYRWITRGLKQALIYSSLKKAYRRRRLEPALKRSGQRDLPGGGGGIGPRLANGKDTPRFWAGPRAVDLRAAGHGAPCGKRVRSDRRDHLLALASSRLCVASAPSSAGQKCPGQREKIAPLPTPWGLAFFRCTMLFEEEV